MNDISASSPLAGAPSTTLDPLSAPVSGPFQRPLAERTVDLPRDAGGLRQLENLVSAAPLSQQLNQIEREMRAGLFPLSGGSGTSLVDTASAWRDDRVVGEQLHALAGEIDQRVGAGDAAGGSASALAHALRGRAVDLMDGAPAPNVLAAGDSCYADAASAGAAMQAAEVGRAYVSALTPEAQRRNADRHEAQRLCADVWTERPPGTGFTWAQTSLMYACGAGVTDPAELRRAYAGGQLLDVGLSVSSRVSAIAQARQGVSPGVDTRSPNYVENLIP